MITRAESKRALRDTLSRVAHRHSLDRVWCHRHMGYLTECAMEHVANPSTSYHENNELVRFFDSIGHPELAKIGVTCL